MIKDTLFFIYAVLPLGILAVWAISNGLLEDHRDRLRAQKKQD